VEWGANKAEIPFGAKARVMTAAGIIAEVNKRFSSVADNVAAYKMCYKLLGDTIEETYGSVVRTKYGPDTKVLDKFSRVHDAVFTSTIKLAEYAGSMTKLGSPTNFLQEEVELFNKAEADDYINHLPEGKKEAVKVEQRGNLYVIRTSRDFRWYDNKYARTANNAMMIAGLALLAVEITAMEKELSRTDQPVAA
jgi:hypothetical protein